MSDKVEALIDALERAVTITRELPPQEHPVMTIETEYDTDYSDEPADEAAPLLRSVPELIVVTVLFEEHVAKSWLTGNPVTRLNIDRLVKEQIEAALEERAPIDEGSRVLYAGTKRTGNVSNMHVHEGRPYATVLWDEWTKSPFTTVPLENLRKE